MTVFSAFGSTGFDLSGMTDEDFIELDQKPVLVPLEDSKNPFDKNKTPLILVHGIRGNPSDLQSIIHEFRDSRYQIYVLAYNDFKRKVSLNGADLGRLLGKFETKDLVIIAHSMGGVVVRKALVDMAENKSIDHFQSVTFFSVDTPWHGFDGPADGSIQMKLAKPFLPDGIEDMRARSQFLSSLYLQQLPSHVSVHLSFAEEGTEAFGPGETEEHFVIEEQFSNFRQALLMDSDKEYPVFPGDHETVVSGPHLLEYLKNRLSH